MLRQDILNEISLATGEDVSLYEKYSTSDLKKILDDIMVVKVAADSSINGTILLIGIFILLAITLIRK